MMSNTVPPANDEAHEERIALAGAIRAYVEKFAKARVRYAAFEKRVFRQPKIKTTAVGVRICCEKHYGWIYLQTDRAKRYLEWLDAGNVGRHDFDNAEIVALGRVTTPEEEAVRQAEGRPPAPPWQELWVHPGLHDEEDI